MKEYEYQEKDIWHISCTKELKNRGKERAYMFSKKGGKSPNISKVGRELVEIGFIVIELFGEDWKDALQVQAKPEWTKILVNNQLKIINLIENLDTVSVEKKAEMIEEIKETMDIDGMLE